MLFSLSLIISKHILALPVHIIKLPSYIKKKSDNHVIRAKAQLEINGLVKRLFYTTNLNVHLHGFL